MHLRFFMPSHRVACKTYLYLPMSVPVIAFYPINGNSADAEILVGEFLDGYSKEPLWDMGYFRGSGSEPFNQLFLLFRG